MAQVVFIQQHNLLMVAVEVAEVLLVLREIQELESAVLVVHMEELAALEHPQVEQPLVAQYELFGQVLQE
jgi:hypothetical protein